MFTVTWQFYGLCWQWFPGLLVLAPEPWQLPDSVEPQAFHYCFVEVHNLTDNIRNESMYQTYKTLYTLKVSAHTESEIFIRNFRTLKNKYDLTLCQSRLHTAFRPSKKNRIRFDFLRFRIRCMHFDRNGWRIWKNRKTHAKISDSVCNGLNDQTEMIRDITEIFLLYRMADDTQKYSYNVIVISYSYWEIMNV